MKRVLLTVCLAFGCQPHPQPTPEQAATTSPASEPWDRVPIDPDLRKTLEQLGWFRSSLVQFQQAYLSEEGYSRRSLQFHRLAAAIALFHDRHQATQYEMFLLLGPPDLWSTRDEMLNPFDRSLTRVEVWYVYLYSRKGPKDSYVAFRFDRDGAMSGFGHDSAEALEMWKYRAFPPWKIAPPRAANEDY